jgi:hypothetical protein
MNKKERGEEGKIKGEEAEEETEKINAGDY